MSHDTTNNLYRGVDLYDSVKQRPKRKAPSILRHVSPRSAEEIAEILTNPNKYPSPVRPVGSDSSITRCNETATGTLIDMTKLDKVLSIDKDTVTVQAGIRLRDLAEYLAHDEMELVVGCADPKRTVGGAISSGALGSGQPGDGSQLCSSVVQVSLINGLGKRVEVGENLPDLLTLARMSYGLLGIVYSVKLRIRAIRPYAVSTSKVDLNEFVALIPNLLQAHAVVKASVLPFRNRAYVELRYPDDNGRKAKALPFKLRNWAVNSAVPKLARSVGKVVPGKNIRDPLIDTLAGVSEGVFASMLNGAGSNAAEQTGQFKALPFVDENLICTWFFPVAQFGQAIAEYAKFSQRHYKKTGYRCDLPAEVWRVDQDQYALLSPSFDGPVFALSARSTREEGWDDYLLEFAEFAANYHAIPLFNQTRGVKPKYAIKAYGERLTRFANLRGRLDPANRLLNQYFAEHVG